MLLYIYIYISKVHHYIYASINLRYSTILRDFAPHWPPFSLCASGIDGLEKVAQLRSWHLRTENSPGNSSCQILDQLNPVDAKFCKCSNDSKILPQDLLISQAKFMHWRWHEWCEATARFVTQHHFPLQILFAKHRDDIADVPYQNQGQFMKNV